MTPPRIVVFATRRLFRVQCDTLLRAAGARVRLASRQAELAKAISEGTIAAIIVEDDRDAAVAQLLARGAATGTEMAVMQRAPGESIEEIVARALGATDTEPDTASGQPRSSE